MIKAADKTPGETIAAALRKSPIYTDPALARALTGPQRAALLAAIRRSPIPVYVLLVPLINGAVWDDAHDLATVVHDRLGRDGAYVTLDEKFSDVFNAYRWAGGAEESYGDTYYAAAAVGFQDDMRDRPVGERLLRCVELITAGGGKALYKRLTARYDSPAPAAGPRSGTGAGAPAWPLPVAAAGAVTLALLGGLAWRRRRVTAVRAAEAASPSLPSPRRVFATADKATRAEVRAEADRQLLALGERLESTPTDGAGVARALDAYQAAAKVLDTAGDLPDLVGALVLLDQGRDTLDVAAGAARAASPLCFFNPLHGDATRAPLDWRPLGTRRTLSVHACRTCVKAVRARETPEILMDGTVPYFEADPDQSVWAATGYGHFRDDLIDRVLRGDLDLRHHER